VTTTKPKSAPGRATPTKEKVDFDLDTFDRPDAKPPFKVRLGGRVYVLGDPLALDYRDLLRAQELYVQGMPAEAINLMVTKDDRDAFFMNDLPIFKLRAMFEAYNKHYGIDPGEAPASPTS
jgi:hypothetical protein